MKISIAPMEGVVDFVIRDIFTSIGGYDQCVTEFIRITTQLLPSKVYHRYCPELLTNGKTKAGVPVFIQLLGSDSICLAENAGSAVDLGALGIDLNFGCPAKTVNRHDGGATLLKNPQRLFDVISAVKSAVGKRVPVTAKVRLGFENKDLHKEIAKAVDEAGADHLMIHARTKEEGYKPPAHWEYIAKMKEGISIPVIANGDLWTLKDYIKCLEITGCKDVALGRSAFAKPDLALEIKAYNEGQSYKNLEMKDVVKCIYEKFIPMNLELKDEKYALSRTKQWVKALSRNYLKFEDLFSKIKRLQSIQDMKENLVNYF